jgi:hypothetical protein
MKTTVALLVSTIFPAILGAEPAVEDILQKREEILSKLVECARKGVKGGTCSSEQVREATLRLLVFRRDSAKAAADRIKWQEMIVEEERAAVRENLGRVKDGTTSTESALLAEDRLLAAEQKLAELRAAERDRTP